MNEIVFYPVDICVNHQRINEPEDQYHPQRRAGVKEEETEEIGEMKKTRRGRDSILARMREEL